MSPHKSDPAGRPEKPSRPSDLSSLVLTHVDEAIVAVDAGGKVLYWNGAAEALYGIPRAEAVGRRHRDLRGVRWSDPSDEAAMVAQVASRGFWNGSYTLVRRDGVEREIDASVRAVRGADGGVQAHVAVVRDVTGQRRAAADLARTNALLSSVLQRMLAGVVVAEAPSGRIVIGEEHLRHLLGPGVPVGCVDDCGRWGGLGADGRALAADEWPLARSLRRGEVVQDAEIPFVRADGARRTLTMSSSPVSDGTGVVAAFAVALDVTEQRRAAEAAKQTAERYRALLENLREAVTVWELLLEGGKLDAVLRDANPRALLGLGRPWEQVAGRRMTELYSPVFLERYAQPGLEALRTGKAVRTVMRMESNGHDYETCVFAMGQRFLVITGTDLTELAEKGAALR